MLILKRKNSLRRVNNTTMKIQLHELITRLNPNTLIRVERNHVILLEDKVDNIDDLLGYHHNLVEDLYLNMLNILVIVID